MNEVSRSAWLRVSLKSDMSFPAACRDKEGSAAVLIAMANTPRGNSTSRSA